MIDKKEYQKIIVEWNDNKTNYPRNSSVKELFEEIVEKYPDKIALIFKDQKLTYRNLNEIANQFARYLQDIGVSKQEFVGISMDKSIDFIIGILAILKVGGIYVPIDANYPDERKQFIIHDGKIKVLIIQENFLNKFSNEHLKEVCLTKIKSKLSQCSKENLKIDVNPLDIAYVNYTSGTTGVHKGVEVYNRGIIRLIKNTNWINILAEDCFLQIANISFDATTFEVWGALLNGATLCIYPFDKIIPHKVAELLDKEKITQAIFTAKIFNIIIDEQVGSLKNLRYLQSVGEVMSIAYAKKAFNELHNTKIINGYGPTENTTFTTTYTINSINDIEDGVPIGKPISNTSVYILDQNMKPVPIGVTGELYTGGDGVAKGYLNQKELTEKAFIKDPFSEEIGSIMYRTGDLACFLPDGNILFKGRIDKQIKIRGFRIELKEIEAVTKKIEGVLDCVCIVCEEIPGQKQLALYVEGQKELTSEKLREIISLKLPHYSIPDYIIVMDKLPLNSSGKIDRYVLSFPRKILSKEKPQRLKSSFEQIIAKQWKSILKLEKIDREDNFFYIGGDSITAVELATLLSKELKKEIPDDVIFEFPTLKEYAKKIEEFLMSTKDQLKKEILHNQFWTWRDKEIWLDPEIGKEKLSIPKETQFTNPQNIFLTGSSGFVGSFTLKSLLDNTKAKIYCHVRADSTQEGFLRIKSKMIEYEIWKETYSDRIVPIIGNLEEKLLGIEPKIFEKLAEKIDSVFHVGANVNHVLSYETLKLSNVFGTQEIIRLSMKKKNKPLHYVSTIDVFEANGRINEEEDLLKSQNLSTGYAESKWVAEKIIQIARTRGLFVSIYRLARVMGSSNNGSGPISDFLWRMVQACIYLKSIPLISIKESMTPVDLTANALVYISKKPDCIDKEYHLFNSKKINYQQLFKFMQIYGYELKEMDFKLWESKLIQESKKERNTQLLAMAALLSKHDLSTFSQTSDFICSNAKKALQDSSIVWPDIDEQLFKMYLDYYIKIGFLPKP
ncbi:MAG: amino acid adenylation domain-containing protein [Chlamydiae bacterium]|nr:amino acid adenylation domain-containing protein [Chlamydiota bacterium]